jgi:hypothetical protein
MKRLLPVLTILALALPASFAQTSYGFFPSPPQITEQSVRDTVKNMGNHADFMLLQRGVPWKDFVQGPQAASSDMEEIRGLLTLGRASGLGAVFVVDPLNGLDRRELQGLPSGWKASFGDPGVRAAFTNYALRLVRELGPRFIGLASEINTYADFHPEDFPNFLSLYAETYDRIKAERPQTNVFVTFQWEELNSLFPPGAGGRKPLEEKWRQVEAFGARLDLFAVSTYPFVCFSGADKIPKDYYARLAEKTALPIAVAEGGYISRDTGPFHGSPRDQSLYLKAIHSQIGGRLAFWVYLLMSDFNIKSYSCFMRAQGRGKEVETLGIFASCGLMEADGGPKEALRVWDGFRGR